MLKSISTTADRSAAIPERSPRADVTAAHGCGAQTPAADLSPTPDPDRSYCGKQHDDYEQQYRCQGWCGRRISRADLVDAAQGRFALRRLHARATFRYEGGGGGCRAGGGRCPRGGRCGGGSAGSARAVAEARPDGGLQTDIFRFSRVETTIGAARMAIGEVSATRPHSSTRLSTKELARGAIVTD